jgi:hypothetical protein
MSVRQTAMVIVALGIVLGGCGAGETDRGADSEPRETVFDPLTDTLDRAEGVQDTLDERRDRLERELEEAEGR